MVIMGKDQEVKEVGENGLIMFVWNEGKERWK
jgi:hypothetical protein